MRRISRVVLFLLALVAGAASAEAPQVPWAVTNFEVRAVAPIGANYPGRAQLAAWFRAAGVDLETMPADAEFSYVALLRSLGLTPNGPFTEDRQVDPGARSRIELHLRQSAALLERWGFPAPNLKPLVTRSDGLAAYRVYLMRGVEAGLGGYYRGSSCHWESGGGIIVLNADYVLGSDGQPTPAGLQAASHELFHAVQFATPFFTKHACEGHVGAWIMEGTAKAVGWDLTRLLNGARASDVDWGKRRYFERLPVPLTIRNEHSGNQSGKPDPAYGTASFWRYLAEYHAARQTGGALPGPEEHPVDYRYLSRLFAMGRSTRDCATSNAPCKGELQWLDLGLKRLFGRSLREIFPNFGEALVDYGEQRALEGDPKSSGLLWRADVFDGSCYLVELEPSPGHDLVQETVKRFEPTSLQCWEVTLKNTQQPVPVAITATLPGMPPSAALANLSMAVGGRPMFAYKPLLGVNRQSGEASASWIADLPPDNTGHVLISNIADAPVLTSVIENLQVTFTPLTSSVTMSTGGKPSNQATSSAIERPIRIELDKITRKVISPDNTPKAQENASNACTLGISARNSRTRETLHLTMTHSGPIGPGRYQIARSGSNIVAQDNPGLAWISFEVLDANGRLQSGFHGDNGVLEIDTIAGDRMTGRIRGMGHRCSTCVRIGKKPFGVDALAIEVQFSVLLQDPMRSIAALLKVTDDEEQSVREHPGSECLTNGRREG